MDGHDIVGTGLTAHIRIGSAHGLGTALMVLSILVSVTLMVLCFVLTVDARLIGIGGVSKTVAPPSTTDHAALLFPRNTPQARAMRVLGR